MRTSDHRELRKEKLDFEFRGEGPVGVMDPFPNIGNMTTYEIVQTLSKYFGSGTKAVDYMTEITQWMKEEIRNESAKATGRTQNQLWLIETYKKDFQGSLDLFGGNAITLENLRSNYQEVLKKLNEITYE